MQTKRYYLIAGERSGDLHGANLIKAIRQHDSTAAFRAWGGEQMEEAGATLVQHYRETAFMGLGTVIRNLPKVLRFIQECKKDILAYQPDVVILIDYAGFNMRIAKFAKQHGFRTFYYISPKVWAWNQSRAFKIKAFVDRMFVIFPFEVPFFQQYDYQVDYVGNPLLDAIAAFETQPNFREKHKLGTKPIIALLPGSRRQEVTGMLSVMLSTVKQFPDYQFVVAGVTNLPEELYQALLLEHSDVKIIFDAAYDLLSVAEAALVTSGTATLETALFNVPQVVCYRTGALTYFVSRRLIKVPFISLVNLIAQKAIVRELIQQEFTIENVVTELKKITINLEGRTQQLVDYQKIKLLMGESGASERAAKLMVQYLNEGSNK